MLALRPRPLSALKSAGYSGNGGKGWRQRGGGRAGCGGGGGGVGGGPQAFFSRGLGFTLCLKCQYHQTHNPLLNV